MGREISGNLNPNWHGGKVIKKCSQCDKEYMAYPTKNKKFCSEKCYGKWIGEHQKGKNNPCWDGGKTMLICKQCKKEFKTHVLKKKFCSKKCYGEWHSEQQTGKNNPNWYGGLSFEPYSPNFNKQLKKQIRERDNYTCQECGYTKIQLGYTLDVHHVDYDKKNSIPNNLISLCRSCHIKTNYNRQDWTKYYKGKIRCQN